MTTEADILHENGDYWVLRERKTFLVMKNVGTHSVSDSEYDYLSLAIARCNYLAKRAGAATAFRLGLESSVRLP